MNQRLLFVSHSHKLEGGAELSLLETVRFSDSKKYSCLVILPQEGSFAEALNKLNIPYKIESYTWSAMSSYDSEAHLNLGISHFNADSIIAAYHTINDFKPDLVIVNTIMPPWYAYAARALDVPTIMMIRESFDKRNSTRLLPSAEEYLDNLDHVIDHVLYNSNYTRDMYSKHITRPKSSVYYPIVRISKDQESLTKSSISPLSNRISIITSGSIVEHKNQLELLEALQILVGRGYKNIHVTLMGYADKKGYIKILRNFIKSNNLHEHVSILKFSETPFNEFTKNQIVVVPSKSEAFGRVTLEGQLLGRLVVGCNSGGTKEIIEDTRTGLLYQPGEPEDLANKLEWAMKNPNESAEIAKRGQKRAKKKFLSDKSYEPFIDAVNELTNQRTRNSNRVAFYDPVYALIQRNLHVNSILDEYAKSLEEASLRINTLMQRTAADDLKKHTRRLLNKLKR